MPAVGGSSMTVSPSGASYSQPSTATTVSPVPSGPLLSPRDITLPQKLGSARRNAYRQPPATGFVISTEAGASAEKPAA